MNPQILSDTYRIRGSLGHNQNQTLFDIFGNETGHDSNRLPHCRPSRNDRTAAFTKIRAEDLYRGMYERVVEPHKINQEKASLCGPASLMFLLATRYPTMYTRYIGDLYEFGEAQLGQLKVKPGKDCKNYDPKEKINPADWVGLAGLRDSENVFFDYDEVEDEFAGITMPGQLAKWFSKVGFSDVRNETNIYLTKGEDDFREAAELYTRGFAVCLFIDAGVINGMPAKRSALRQMFTTPNHWVVLTSMVSFKPNNSVSFDVYTWGTDPHPVPPLGYDGLDMDTFLQYFYGYVAASS